MVESRWHLLLAHTAPKPKALINGIGSWRPSLVLCHPSMALGRICVGTDVSGCLYYLDGDHQLHCWAWRGNEGDGRTRTWTWGGGGGEGPQKRDAFALLLARADLLLFRRAYLSFYFILLLAV